MHSAILDEPFIRISGLEEWIVMLMVDGLRRIRFVDRKSAGRGLSRGPANRGSRASSTAVSPFKFKLKRVLVDTKSDVYVSIDQQVVKLLEDYRYTINTK